MAIAESGPKPVGPSPQAAGTTSTSTNSRHSGLGAQGAHSFASLMNGIAERGQAQDDIPPGGDARQQQRERRPQIDRGRAKPTSNGRVVSARSSTPGAAAQDLKDAVDAAAGAPRSLRAKAGAGSEGPVTPTAASDERGGALIVTDPQPPPIDLRTANEHAFAVEPLAATAPVTWTPAGVPSGAAAPASEPSSSGLIAAIGPDAQSVDLDATAASTETILDAVTPMHSTDVAVSADGKVEVPLLDGASRPANVSRATGHGSAQGRHGEDRGTALAAVRDALAATVQSPLTSDRADATPARVDSLPANASGGAHDVPSALAAYSLFAAASVDASPAIKTSPGQSTGEDTIRATKTATTQSTAIDATHVAGAATSQSTDAAVSLSTEDASSDDGREGVQTELMPTGEQTRPQIATPENRFTAVRAWVAPTATMDRSAVAGPVVRVPVVRVPNGVETHPQSSDVTAATESGVSVPTAQRTSQLTGVTSARGTLRAEQSSAVAGALAPLQAPEAPAELVRDASQASSGALDVVDASVEKASAATPVVSVDVPVREVPRVALPRRSQTAIALPSSPASVTATSKTSEHGPTSQVAAVSPTDMVPDAAAGSSRQTRPSSGRSPSDTQQPSQFDPLAEQNLGVVSTTATSTASPARKIDVLTQASPRPTGTAAIAIAAFQAAAAAAPDVHRSASIVGTSAASAALLDAQIRMPIVDAIRVQADNGNGQVRLRLNPEYLGDVSVDVRVNGGSVIASVHASSADVREWLRTNEAMLRQTLADQGLHLERLVVAEEDTQPGKEHSNQQREGASDQQREWERRSRRPRSTGTFEVVL